MAVVEVQNLTKWYGQTPALREVSLRIEGGVTGLLGPNGAGKSTLLLCVLGLLPDWRGDVRVLGMDARRQGRALRRRVGFMPETDTWLPDATALRATRLLARLSGLPWDEALRRAHEVLYFVGLGEAVYRDLATHSSGMRQRFKLAQALVHDPEVLFLDEPLAGLDPQGRDELLSLVRGLARDHGKHVIWSSHILPEVQKVADRVIVLHRGRCRGAVDLGEVGAGDGRYAVEVEGEDGAFRAGLAAAGIRVESADPAGPDAGAGPGRRRLTAVLPADRDASDLLRLARHSGVRLRRAAPLGESLDEIFHRLLDGGEGDDS